MKFLKTIRSNDWWEYKLPPLLAIGYATALLDDQNLLSLFPRLIFLISAIVVGAIYVSLLNDFTDLEEDMISGKSNRLKNASQGKKIFLVCTGIVLGVPFFIFFYKYDVLSLIFYLCSWILFTLYSLPPFRFKNRKILGVLADAGGAHLFPSLLFVSSIFDFSGEAVDLFWLGLTGVWAFSYGLRGILWHQFLDRENDRLSGLKTYAVSRDPAAFASIARLIIAVEFLTLILMLYHLWSLFPVLAFFVYLGVLLFYSRKLKRTIILIIPIKNDWHIFLSTYYQFFLPLSLLVSASIKDPRVLFLISLQLILFPSITRNFLHDAKRILYLSELKRFVLQRF